MTGVAKLRAWLATPSGYAWRRLAILVVGVQCLRVTLEGTEDRLTRLEKDVSKVTGWVPHDDIATLDDLDKVAAGKWTLPAQPATAPDAVDEAPSEDGRPE